VKKTEYQAQVASLLAAINKHSSGSGVDLGVQHHNALLIVLHWVDYLRNSELTNCCDEILDGVKATAVEASGCIALGLVRPAIFALRAQIDATVTWLYFKDHPVEWDYLMRTGDGFKSRSEILDFFTKFVEKFNQRFMILSAHKKRTVDQPYRLLSAHIHGQSKLVVPTFQNLEAMVYPEQQCKEAVSLQIEVSEYVNDIFLAYFASKWPSLPDEIIKSAKSRIPAEKHAKLFA
jgi:hypothetical protein